MFEQADYVTDTKDKGEDEYRQQNTSQHVMYDLELGQVARSPDFEQRQMHSTSPTNFATQQTNESIRPGNSEVRATSPPIITTDGYTKPVTANSTELLMLANDNYRSGDNVNEHLQEKTVKSNDDSYN